LILFLFSDIKNIWIRTKIFEEKEFDH